MAERFEDAGNEPRSVTGREWEVFVREHTEEPLRHVGSVSAPTEAVAHDRAERLFGWAAGAVWLCPADEVRRFSARQAWGEGGEPATGDD